jgi:hypothetical protein
MLAAAAIIGYSSYSMFRKAIRMPKIAPQGESAVTGKDLEKEAEKAARAAQAAQAAAAQAQAAQAAAAQGKGQPTTTKAAANATKTASALKEEPFKLSVKKIALCLLIGLIAGLASGYVGVGGGFIMVPLFISLLGIMMRQASGTSLVAVTILAIPGVVEQGLLGHIDYIAGIAMAVGSIPGAVIGASLIRKVPERKLRFVFGAFLLISAVVLLFNELLPLFV